MLLLILRWRFHDDSVCLECLNFCLISHQQAAVDKASFQAAILSGIPISWDFTRLFARSGSKISQGIARVVLHGMIQMFEAETEKVGGIIQEDIVCFGA